MVSRKLVLTTDGTQNFADDGLHQRIQRNDEEEKMTMGMLSIS